MLTNKEFVSTLIDLATKKKTLYVLGGFGQKLAPYYKEYFITHYGFNRSVDYYGRDRKELIMNASEDTLAYDCVCMVKSVLNGSKGYTTSPCPDIAISALFRQCKNGRRLSGELPNVGDFLTFADFSHCGVYVGDGRVVECTYRDVEHKGKDGVQITNFYSRYWIYAGALPYLKEEDASPANEVWGVQTCACRKKENAEKYKQPGQNIYKVGGYYKVAFAPYSSEKEAREHLEEGRKMTKDAFIAKYPAGTLVI